MITFSVRMLTRFILITLGLIVLTNINVLGLFTDSPSHQHQTLSLKHNYPLAQPTPQVVTTPVHKGDALPFVMFMSIAALTGPILVTPLSVGLLRRESNIINVILVLICPTLLAVVGIPVVSWLNLSWYTVMFTIVAIGTSAVLSWYALNRANLTVN